MHSPKLTVLSLICALVLSSCASVSSARPDLSYCPKPQAAPPAVMQPVQADFLMRMRNFLFASPDKPTP